MSIIECLDTTLSSSPKLFDAGDYNLFRYCGNDPIDFTDPMGTETNYAGFSPLTNRNASVADDPTTESWPRLSGRGAI